MVLYIHMRHIFYISLLSFTLSTMIIYPIIIKNSNKLVLSQKREIKKGELG